MFIITHVPTTILYLLIGIGPMSYILSHNSIIPTNNFKDFKCLYFTWKMFLIFLSL